MGKEWVLRVKKATGVIPLRCTVNNAAGSYIDFMDLIRL